MKKTVAEYLRELKVLDSRIVDGTQRLILAGVKIGPKLPVGFTSTEEFSKSVTGSLDSVKKLIGNRAAIKSAIVTSNAITKITIAGGTMTVAEAIECKSSIGYYKDLLAKLEQQYASNKNAVDRGNADVKVRLDGMLLASRGKEAKADADAEKAFTDTFMSNNEYTLLDPADLRKSIEDVRTFIEDFTANVDVQLSISNATTEIEVNI